MTDRARPAGSPPSALESLGASHRCISILLARLEHLLGQGGDRRELRVQFHEIATGLDSALGNHLLDEERDVFPALLAAARSPDRHAQAFELVSRLLVEHREMTEIWSRLRIALRALSAGLAGPPFEADARQFIALCRRHLDHEDREFGDLMQAVPTAQLASMALSIARRHADAGPPAEGDDGKGPAAPSGAAAQ